MEMIGDCLLCRFGANTLRAHFVNAFINACLENLKSFERSLKLVDFDLKEAIALQMSNSKNSHNG